MNPKQKSDRARTGDRLAASGTWLIRCMREGCFAVERLNLHQGAPAPPCRLCLNPAWLRFLHAPVPAELPAAAAPRPAVAQASAPIVEAPMPVLDSVILTPAEKPAADPAEKKNVEAPAIAEVKPTLFQQLAGSRLKSANAPGGGK